MDLNAMVTDLMGFDLSSYSDLIIKWIIGYIPNIIGALLVLWIGFKIINLIERGIHKVMDRQKINPMLKSFISSLSSMLLKIMVIIAAAWVLWVQTSSFVAMLAAAWFAIGMALSWTLKNFAWWVVILLLKPFKIGHFVEIGSYMWTVKEISIFNTTIITTDKKRVIIPNSDIANWSITNFSAEPIRRIDLIIWVGYSEDIDKVKKTLLEIAQANETILQDEDIVIWLTELAASSVNFNFKFHVKSSDYLQTKHDVLEEVKKTFDKKKIWFPFPQRDVHLYNEK